MIEPGSHINRMLIRKTQSENIQSAPALLFLILIAMINKTSIWRSLQRRTYKSILMLSR